jgi:hypothetical protein
LDPELFGSSGLRLLKPVKAKPSQVNLTSDRDRDA